MQGTILVIDDDDQVRSMLKTLLEKEGYTVQGACDGKEGLKIYQEHEFDLVITDIIMPEKEGIETIRELRQYNPDVNIIAVSGGGAIEADKYLLLAKGLGVRYTFEKPFRRNDLLAAVRELL